MKIDPEALAELVREIAGKDVIPLIEFLNDKDYISEFVLADKLKLTVNQVRNMLYRLYSSNLVSFVRKKDKKKGTAKEGKSKANVDERVKQVNAIQPPEHNPYRLENERRIDLFWRYSRRGKDPRMKMTIRQIRRERH